MKIEISSKDWNAIRLFIREEESVLKENYGIPGRMAATWEAEYKEANPRAFKIFDAARQAIERASVVPKKPVKSKAVTRNAKVCVHGYRLGTPAGNMHHDCARMGSV